MILMLPLHLADQFRRPVGARRCRLAPVYRLLPLAGLIAALRASSPLNPALLMLALGLPPRKRRCCCSLFALFITAEHGRWHADFPATLRAGVPRHLSSTAAGCIPGAVGPLSRLRLRPSYRLALQRQLTG
jgi:hypothetical protein